MTYIAEPLRRLVFQRASGQCEYCLIHENYTIKRHEYDHIYAEKHGGMTLETNLCLCCIDCNRYKGSDLCSIDTDTETIVTLFHPRQDIWADHFKVNANGRIEALTPRGRVTARLLRFNDDDRVDERDILIRLKRYPLEP